MVECSCCLVGVMMVVSVVVLVDGIVVNLVGGMYYVYVDKGGGFCVFNDVVIVLCWM